MFCVLFFAAFENSSLVRSATPGKMSLSDFSSTSDRHTNELTFYEMTFTYAELEIEGDNDDRIKKETWKDMERHGKTWKT